MSDRTSPEIFYEIFKRLAQDPTPQHKKWAQELFKLAATFDFCDENLECDAALVDLGLADTCEACGETIYLRGKNAREEHEQDCDA